MSDRSEDRPHTMSDCYFIVGISQSRHFGGGQFTLTLQPKCWDGDGSCWSTINLPIFHRHVAFHTPDSHIMCLTKCHPLGIWHLAHGRFITTTWRYMEYTGHKVRWPMYTLSSPEFIIYIYINSINKHRTTYLLTPFHKEDFRRRPFLELLQSTQARNGPQVLAMKSDGQIRNFCDGLTMSICCPLNGVNKLYT